jgi:hypothetical protein
MASNTVVQVKRTAISGRPANTTTISNPGELALNMTDGILYSTNGSIVFEIGANNTNVRVSNTLTVKAISANSSVGAEGEVLTSNGSGVYWHTVTGYAGSQGYTGSASTAAGYAGSRGYDGSQGYTGSKGDTGDQGIIGVTGYTGSQGTAGYVGSQGYSGSRGYSGSVGFVGSQGYSGSQGYTGSQGTTGYTGSVGYVGSLGYTGSQGYTGSGYTGSQGTTGYTGSFGYSGSLGYTGSQGYTGSGYTGSQGYSGSVGYSGSKGYTGSAGNDGDLYATTSTTLLALGNSGTATLTLDNTAVKYTVGQSIVAAYDINNIQYGTVTSYNSGTGVLTFVKTSFVGSGTFVNWAVNLLGVQGAIGYTGSFGYVGSLGYTGSRGYTGSKGTTYIGNTAPAGAIAGDTWWNNYDGVRYVYYTDVDTTQWVQESAVGPIGYTGSAGTSGTNGYTGSTGAGYTGSASTAAGYTGSQGAIGYTGSLGYTGSQGYTGSVGNGGSQGYSGSQGYNGSQGYTGSLGYAGSQGYSGSVGYTGSAGYTGSQGVIGYTGSVASGPAFSAYPSGAQTITSGSLQKMLFQTEEYDTNNNFASSRFTPTVAGYYQFNATVRIDGATGTGECMIVLFKNNAEYKRGWNSLGVQFASSFWSMSVSAQAYANGSSDYFEIYIQQGNGSSLDTSPYAPITYFQGCMIRAA